MAQVKRNASIGVFDSGFGGLAILKEIQKMLPQYRYVYLGDTARTPYGTRSKEVVYQFTLQAIDFLFKHNCEIIIIACNTASAEALRRIQQEYLPKKYPNRRVLGVLIPAAEEAVLRTKNRRIGVLATEGTVQSGAFPREIRKIGVGVSIFQQAAPLLVPLVEEGEHRSKAAELIVRKYLRPLQDKGIDTLILGCTHYGHLEGLVKKIVGKNIKIISEGRVVAGKLKDYLKRHPEIESRLTKKRQIVFYSTDLTDRFKRLGKVFFGKPVQPAPAELK